MILYVLLIAAILGGGLYAFRRWSQRVGPEQTRAVLKKTGLVVLAVLAVGLVIRSGSALLALLALVVPFINRLLPLAQTLMRMLMLKRQMGPIFRRGGYAGAAAAGGATGQSRDRSRVTTHHLDMELDHATGELDGEVLTGRFKNNRLSELDLPDLLELRDECLSDAQSVAVLESYLDRIHPDWRKASGRRASSDRGDAGLSLNEAYDILGLKPGATREDIIAAHRRLMQKLHPDHGGSDYLASRVNSAKQILLDDLV
jgi:hypothetical protein